MTMYRNQAGTGCTGCDAGFSGFFITNAVTTRVCAQNTSIASAQTTAFPTNSDFIDYCRNYNNESTHKCHKCYDDGDNDANRKVLSENQLLCVQTGMQNCEVSTSDNVCKQCK